MVVLVDTKYIGRNLRFVRKTLRIRRRDAAKVLKITLKQLTKYEEGKEIIPENILCTLFYHGLLLVQSKQQR